MRTILVMLVLCSALAGSSPVDSISNAKYLDGSQHTINGLGITYTQRVSDDGQCSVEVNQQPKQLYEGELIKLKNKWYKVTDCRLNRAYPVSCGSKLFYQLRDLACSFADEASGNKKRLQRQTKDKLMDIADKLYSDPCCESACTINEFLKYCPAQ